MIVSPVLFTDQPQAYAQILKALGASAITETDHWSEYALGSGKVGLHPSSPQRPVGTVRLSVQVEDVTAWAQRMEAQVIPQGHGLEAEFTAADGMQLVANQLSPTPPTSSAVMVLPLWMTPDVQGATAVLTKAGLAPRISADSGRWFDFTATDGGGIAVHEDARSSAVLAFEADDLEALAEPLDRIGADPRIIDESYGRSLQFLDPDGGPLIWVNQRQTDLYGYTRHN